MSNLHTGRLGKASMKFETTWGTFIDGDRPLRLISESIKTEVGKVTDEALIGEVFTTQRNKVSENIAGSIELETHPEEFGPLMYYTLGEQAAVGDPVLGYILVSYFGAENYTRVSKVANDILFEKSTDGSSWSPDTAVNTTGTIDVTVTTTLSTVQALIDASVGWRAYLLTSNGTEDSAQLVDFAATETYSNGAHRQAISMKATDSVSTTTKSHVITPAAATTKLPSATILVDRTLTAGADAFVGCKVTTSSMSVSAAEAAKLSLSITGKDLEQGKTYPSLTIPTDNSYVAPKICMYINGLKIDETKDFSIAINGNLTQDNVLCSYNITEQIRQAGEITITSTANLDDTADTGNYQFFTQYLNGTPIEIMFFMESTSYADEVNSVLFNSLIRVNKCDLDDYTPTLPGPGILTIPLSGLAVNSDDYDHIVIETTDDEITTYA